MIPERKRIAVIGSGIAGLSAAWLLSKNHDVTVFESDNRLGGHTNTINIDTPEGTCAVDTGFIVYNPPNYPNLVALFERLKIPVKPAQMGFSTSLRSGEYEYSGSGLAGFFGQGKNFFSFAHWSLLKDLLHFFYSAGNRSQDLDDEVSLGEFLAQEKFSESFVQDHLLPMAAAIWSSPATDMMDYPAKAFILFFENHGLLKLVNRPPWMTVDGGAKTYIDRLCTDGSFAIELSQTVTSIRRGPDMVAIETSDSRAVFDDVVLAVHADQAMSIIAEPSVRERELLGAFSYTDNLAVVHSDISFMPRRENLWSSWNYIERGDGKENVPLVSYWMNCLQSLPTKRNIFVTLNPDAPVRPDHHVARFTYQHPVFDARALAAQKQLWELQGNGNIWFCGSYFGAGFHEDALQSGLAVAEQLGGVARPWQLEANASNDRIYLPTASTPAMRAA